ncbi:MAG: FAD binding domain-containing protein [Dehalococcoidia bacterium]
MNYVRRLPKFEYVAPKSLSEACSFLASNKGKAKVLAGGTDLLPQLKKREETPEYLLGLRSIRGLSYIKGDAAKGLKIGPLATIHDLETSSAVRDGYDILNQAAHDFASTQIRNVATVAGNVCHAAPSADTLPPLVALGARLKVVSSRGERTVPLQEVFTTPYHTTLADDELVAEIQVPKLPPGSGGAYLKHMIRQAMDRAFVNVAVILTRKGDVCSQAKIVVGVCSHCWRRPECKPRCPFPTNMAGAEDVLKGEKLGERLIGEAARRAAKESRPRVEVDYKRHLIEVLTRRALSQAWQQAQG